jgi:hypothetical protein
VNGITDDPRGLPLAAADDAFADLRSMSNHDFR